MDYENLAYFAKTYGMIYMMVLFAAICVWAYWPRNRESFDDAAKIPFRED